MKGAMRKLSVKQAACLMPNGSQWAGAEHHWWAQNVWNGVALLTLHLGLSCQYKDH